jgi:hypothetical protein
MIRSAPPQAGQVSMSMPKNRLQPLRLGYRMRALDWHLLLAVQQTNSEPGVSGKSET